MTVALICVTLIALAAASAYADRRFRTLDRIPMQWSLRGKVNWSAPRRLGLAFTPLLAAVTLIALAANAEPGGATVLGTVALGFVAAHLLHFYLIARSTR